MCDGRDLGVVLGDRSREWFSRPPAPGRGAPPPPPGPLRADDLPLRPLLGRHRPRGGPPSAHRRAAPRRPRPPARPAPARWAVRPASVRRGRSGARPRQSRAGSSTCLVARSGPRAAPRTRRSGLPAPRIRAVVAALRPHPADPLGRAPAAVPEARPRPTATRAVRTARPEPGPRTARVHSASASRRWARTVGGRAPRRPTDRAGRRAPWEAATTTARSTCRSDGRVARDAARHASSTPSSACPSPPSRAPPARASPRPSDRSPRRTRRRAGGPRAPRAGARPSSSTRRRRVSPGGTGTVAFLVGTGRVEGDAVRGAAVLHARLPGGARPAARPPRGPRQRTARHVQRPARSTGPSSRRA